MTGPSQLLLTANIVLVVIVMLLLQRLFKAASVFKWNPGDNDIQTAQKLIILRMIVYIAFIGIIAAILNAFFG